MRNIPALIQYISERRIIDNNGSGYSFVRELSPNIKDTFFAMSCLKILNADSRDDEIVRFLSGYDDFDFNGAYYAMKCLMLAGEMYNIRKDCLNGSMKGKSRLDRVLYHLHLSFVTQIRSVWSIWFEHLSSPLSALLKRIELSEANLSSSLANSVLILLSNNRLDIMTEYMALEILKAISMRCSSYCSLRLRLKKLERFITLHYSHRIRS